MPEEATFEMPARRFNEDIADFMELMYGPRWQSELAREIEVSDRTMRRWVAEHHTIGNGVWTDIMMLLDVRAGDLEKGGRRHSRPAQTGPIWIHLDPLRGVFRRIAQCFELGELDDRGS